MAYLELGGVGQSEPHVHGAGGGTIAQCRQQEYQRVKGLDFVLLGLKTR